MKKDPKYFLSVEVGDNSDQNNSNVVFQLPLTCEFTITRMSIGSANTACFKILNLGERTRNLIYHDAFDGTRLRAVQFRAGYENFQPLIFNGTILQAFSYRRGTDDVTEIQCLDGGFQSVNGFTSMTVSGGQSASSVLNTLANGLPNTTGVPLIGNFPDSSPRAQVFSGSAWGIIQQISKSVASISTIDNGQVKILNEDEVVNGNIAVITPEDGLLGTPMRSGTLLQFEMLFEPRFTVGAAVQLQSMTNKIFNGTYKVLGFEHNGTISAAVDGSRRTFVSLQLGTKAFKVIQGVVL